MKLLKTKPALLLTIICMYTVVSLATVFIGAPNASAATEDEKLEDAAKAWVGMRSLLWSYGDNPTEPWKSLQGARGGGCSEQFFEKGNNAESASGCGPYYTNISRQTATNSDRFRVGHLLDAEGGTIDSPKESIQVYDKVFAAMGTTASAFSGEDGLGFTKQPNGSFSGGRIDNATVTRILSNSWPTGLAIPSVATSTAPEWITYLSLEAGINSQCLASGVDIRSFKDSSGNVTLVDNGEPVIYKVAEKNGGAGIGKDVDIPFKYFDCKGAIKELEKPQYAKAYSDAFKLLVANKVKSCGEKYAEENQKTLRDACLDGQAHAGDPSYCASTYARSTDLKNACGHGQLVGKDAATSTTTGGDGSSATPTCAVEYIGWIVCPLVSFTASMADQAFGFLSDNFLEIQTGLFDANSPTRSAWSKFLGFANVFLVIGFLVLIFSQMTGFGASNYSIKKMLPKVIMVAILINLSFFIVQLAIDISNLVGYSFKHILADIVPPPSSQGGQPWHAGGGLMDIAGVVLAGGAAAGVGILASGGVTLALLALVATAVSALFSLFVVFVILVLRKVLIVLLIVLAPLAIASMILPGTEKAFKAWKKALIALLLIFPIVGLLFGGSSLASNILASSFATTDKDTTDVLAQLIAVLAQVLPLFLVWPILKKSLDGVVGGGLMGAFHKGAAGLKGVTAKGLKNTSIGKGIANAAAYKRQQVQIKQAKRRSKARGPIGGLYNLAGGRGYGKRRKGEGVALENEEENKAVGEESARMMSQYKPSGILAGAEKELEKALAEGDSVKARAATQHLLAQKGKGRKALKRIIANHQQANGNDSSKFVNDAYESMQGELGGLKEKDNTLDNIGFSKRTISDIQNDISTYSSLEDYELAGQDPGDLGIAVSNDHISADRAQRMLSNSNLKLTEEKRSLLQRAIDSGNTGMGARSFRVGGSKNLTATSGISVGAGSGSSPIPSTSPAPATGSGTTSGGGTPGSPAPTPVAQPTNPTAQGPQPTPAAQPIQLVPGDLSKDPGLLNIRGGKVSDINTRQEFQNETLRRVSNYRNNNP